MNHRAILRDSALVLAAFVAVGGWFAGVFGAVGTAVSGGLMMVNLWVLVQVTLRFTRAMSDGTGAGLVAVALFAKTPLTLGLFAAMMWLFGPVPAALGISSVVLTIMARSLVSLVQTPVEALPQGASRSS